MKAVYLPLHVDVSLFAQNGMALIRRLHGQYYSMMDCLHEIQLAVIEAILFRRERGRTFPIVVHESVTVRFSFFIKDTLNEYTYQIMGTGVNVVLLLIIQIYNFNVQ